MRNAGREGAGESQGIAGRNHDLAGPHSREAERGGGQSSRADFEDSQIANRIALSHLCREGSPVPELYSILILELTRRRDMRIGNDGSVAAPDYAGTNPLPAGAG